MIRVFLFILTIFTFLQSETFEERQNVLQDIKNVIQYEESVARIYELYILDNFKLPTIGQINTILDGNIKDFVSPINKDKINLATLTSGLPKISYALLSDDLKKDASIKSLYESNTYRKRTYIRDGGVYFIIEDSFAKHLFDLIKFNDGNEIEDCKTIPIKVCKFNNHIYIKPEVISPFKYLDGVDGLKIEGYLINYHIDKFKTGPIIITDDTSKHITENAFDSIPKGALLYDTNGVKYLKTLDGIEVLK